MTFAEASTGTEWMRSPSGLSTVHVVPMSCGVGLGVGLVTIAGVPVAVVDALDGTAAHAESSAIAASRPGRVRRRARAGIQPLTR